MAGDWNVTPDALVGIGWVATTGGMVLAPELPTCNNSTYDFFVICKELQHAVERGGVRRLEDGCTNPHFPVRLLLRGDGSRYAVRKLARPKKVEATLPHGPPHKPPSYAAGSWAQQECNGCRH